MVIIREAGRGIVAGHAWDREWVKSGKGCVVILNDASVTIALKFLVKLILVNNYKFNN